MSGTVGNELWHDLGANPQADIMVDALRELDGLLQAMRQPDADPSQHGHEAVMAMRTIIGEAHRGGVNRPAAWIVGRMAAGQPLFDLLDHALAAAMMWTDDA